MIKPSDSFLLSSVSYRRLTVSATVWIALLAAWRIVTVAGDHLTATYDLSYEGPQIRSIQLFAAGTNPYAADVYNDVPFTITFYPPLYPWLVSFLPPGENVFVTGRIVSLCFMLAAGGCILAVGRHTIQWSILACASFFMLWPVSTNAAFVKCDSMALAFSAASVAILQRCRKPPGVVAAGFLAGMAMAAKQSYISASLAGFLFLCMADRRRAVDYLVAVTATATGIGLAATAAYGGGMWVAVSSFSVNTVSMQTAISVLLAGLCQPLFVVLIGLVCLSLAPTRTQTMAALDGQNCLATLYAFVATVVALLTVGKEGSSTNYLLEPALGLAMTLATRYGTAAAVSCPSFRDFVGPMLIVGCGIWDTVAANRSAYNLCHLSANKERGDLVVRRRTAINQLAGDSPAVLNLAWASLTAELPGEVSLSDPFGQLLLYESSSLDVRPLVASVDRTYYDLIVIYPGIADRFLSSNSPVGQVGDALRRRYRPAGLHCDVFCWVPERTPARSATARPEVTTIPEADCD
jgi:hypothetical protein